MGKWNQIDRWFHRVVLHFANFSTSITFMQSDTNTFQFHGKNAEFFKIWIVNLLLTIVTLSLYRPWARVRTKRYLYQNTEINGQRFDFHADPKSMFLGHLLVVAALGVFAVCSVVVPPFAACLAVIFWLAFPFLLVRSVRFNLTNTSAGNVRMGFAGTSGGYYMLLLKLVGMLLLGTLAGFLVGGIFGFVFGRGTIASSIISGLCLVCFEAMAIVYFVWKQALFFANNAQFGDLSFQSELRFGSVLRKAAVWAAIYFAGVVIMVLIAVLSMLSGSSMPNLGSPSALLISAGPGLLFFALPLIAFWAFKAFVQASAHNLYWNHFTVDSRHQFTSNLAIGPFIGLSLRNGILILFTLGLYYPVARVKVISAKLASLSLSHCDQLVAQSKPKESAKGMVADSIFDSLNIDLAL